VRGAVLGRLVLALGASAVLTAVVALGLVSSASSAPPLRAAFESVPSRAVTQTISAAKGGTLSLTAPGGVRIVVKIPPRALLADTNVTATPITRFRVAPVHGGFVAGVQLAPEGLVLLKPGSVEFHPRKGLRPTRRYFLGSQGNGSDVHLTPPAFRKIGRGRKAKLRVVSKPIVPILHFSTVEAFDWSSVKSLRDFDAIRYPTYGIDIVAQDIAVLLGIERQKQLLGIGTELSEIDVAGVLHRARDRVIKPRLAVVTGQLQSRCSMQAVQNAEGALVLALGFGRQEQLLGLDPSFDLAKLMGPLLTPMASCMLQQCARYGPRLSQALITIGRQVGLMVEEFSSRAFTDALLHNLLACSKGEVHLDSAFYFDLAANEFGDNTHWTMRVVGRAPFEVSPEGRWIYPEAPLEYQDAHGSSQALVRGCGTVREEMRVNSNGAFRINQLDFSPIDPAKPDTSPPIQKLSLTITQDPTEYMDYLTDPCLGPNTSEVTSTWVNWLGASHPALRAPDFVPEEKRRADFVAGGAPVIALATYSPQLTAANGAVSSENTLLEVISKPGEMVPMPDPFGEPNS
jgi:hypothetical protein